MKKASTFLINLDRSHDRLDRMSHRFKEADMAFCRISACDGSAWLEESISSSQALYTPGAALKQMGRMLMAGEIGCYVSHLDAARQFLDTDAAWGLILEDDAQVPQDTQAKLAHIIAKLPDWVDCVNLGRRPTHTQRLLDTNTGLTHAHYFPTTTTALLWSRQGASAFLEQGATITYPVDVFLQKWLSARGTGTALTTPLFAPDDSGSEIYQQNRRQGQTRFYQSKRVMRLVSNRINAMHRRASKLHLTATPHAHDPNI